VSAGSRREKYIQSKKEKQALMVHANNRNFLRAGKKKKFQSKYACKAK
jgi:hypothetical protein